MKNAVSWENICTLFLYNRHVICALTRILHSKHFLVPARGKSCVSMKDIYPWTIGTQPIMGHTPPGMSKILIPPVTFIFFIEKFAVIRVKEA